MSKMNRRNFMTAAAGTSGAREEYFPPHISTHLGCAWGREAGKPQGAAGDDVPGPSQESQTATLRPAVGATVARSAGRTQLKVAP